MEVLEIAVGAAFAATGFETWLQTEILSKEFWGWGSTFDPDQRIREKSAKDGREDVARKMGKNNTN